MYMSKTEELASAKKQIVQIWEHCQVNGKTLPSSFFKGTPEEKNEVACHLFRFVCENILDYSPMDMFNFLTFDKISKLGLIKAFNALNFPPEFKNRKTATFYVAILCYPELQNLYGQDKFPIWEMEYNRACNSRRQVLFDKDNIAGAREKAAYLLKYRIKKTEAEKFKTLEDMYNFFADTKRANSYLKDLKLNNALGFFQSPLEFLHEALSFFAYNNDKNKKSSINNGAQDYLQYQISEFDELFKASSIDKDIFSE